MLMNTTQKISDKITVSSSKTMASQVAKFAVANKITWLQKDQGAARSLSTKTATDPQLIIDFTQCTLPIVKNSISDL